MSSNENRNIVKSFFQIGIGTVLGLVIGLLTTPIITRLVEPEEYGKLSIFNLYLSIAIMVLCLGLDQSLLRFYYKKNDIEYKRKLFTKCFFIPFVLVIVSCVLFYFGNSFFNNKFEFSNIIFVFLLGVVFEFINRFSTLLLRLENHSLSYSIAGIINKIVYVLCAIAFIKLSGDTSFKFLAISLILGIAASCIFGIIINHKIWKPFFGSGECQIKISDLLKFGLPFILVSGLEVLFASIDKLCLRYLCDYETVGIYSSALSLIRLFNVVQASFNTVWAPVSVKHYENNPTDTHFYSLCNQAITVVMFLFGFLIIGSKDLLVFLLGEKYRAAAIILPFLCFHPIMYTISETTVTGVVVSKKSYLQIIVVCISCIVNFVGNIVLIPRLGARGAAISTGASYIVFYLIRTIFGKKYFNFDNAPFKFWMCTLMFVCFSILATFVSNLLLNVLFCIGCIIIVAILYWKTLIKIATFSKKYIKNMFKRKKRNL